MRYLRFVGCTVRVWSDECMETVYPDGKKVRAQFVKSDDTRKTAKEHGYDDDVMLMHRHHDLAHTFLAESKGFHASPTLRHAAGGLQVDAYTRQVEEEMVLAFQRYIMTGQIDSRLYSFSPDLQKLKNEFLRIVDLLWQHEKSK